MARIFSPVTCGYLLARPTGVPYYLDMTNTTDIWTLLGPEAIRGRDQQRAYEAAAARAPKPAATPVYWTDEARAEFSADLDRWEAEAAAEEAARRAGVM